MTIEHDPPPTSAIPQTLALHDSTDRRWEFYQVGWITEDGGLVPLSDTVPDNSQAVWGSREV